MTFNMKPIANTIDKIEVVEIGSGDAINVKTPSSDQFQFFKIRGDFFRFSVKAANDAYICLADGPSAKPPIYRIMLGIDNNTRSTIDRNNEDEEVVSAATPELLSASDSRRFWISWAENILGIGREEEPNPFLSYEYDEAIPIKHVGFCTSHGATGEWSLGGRFPLLSLSKLDWIYSESGKIPKGALVGGNEKGRQVYVIRVECSKGVIPGKLVEGDHVCYYGGLDGSQHYTQNYKVLCNFKGKWVPDSNGNVPSGAIEGGKTYGGEILYVGRALHDGMVMTGYVRKSHGCCNIPYLGKEYGYTDYQVLID